MVKKPSKAWWKSYDNMIERLLKNKRFQMEAESKIGSSATTRAGLEYYVNALYGLPKGTKNAAGQVIR